MQRFARALALLTIVSLAACSGGGGSTTPGSGGAPIEYGNVALSIVVPKKTKKSHFVGAGTNSITLTLTSVNGGAPPAGFNDTVTVNTASCPSGPVGAEVCTASSTAPVASDAFSVEAWSGSNGSGNLLSTNVITKTIVAGANTIGLTLDGVVASLAYSTPSVTLANGTAGGNSDSIEALDAAGDTIIAAATGCGASCTVFNTPTFLESDGLTPDYIYWSSNNASLNALTSNGGSQANGEGVAAVNGTSISTPLSVASGTVTAPGGASVTLVPNNGTWIQYDGTAQSASTASVVLTAADSQGHSATFTGTLGNGTIGWTINVVTEHGRQRKLTERERDDLASNAVRIRATQLSEAPLNL